MSVEALHWALSQRKLKPSAWIVLIKLADRHNPDFGCFPSTQRIAEDCNMSRMSVTRHLNELELMGLIRRENREKETGEKTSNMYHLSFKTDVTNCDIGSNKLMQPHVTNCGSNLVSNNLVSIKDNIPQFDEFWEAYPKKMAKGQARKAWAKAIKADTPQKIIDAAVAYAISQQGKDKQFIPYPASWLNAERWRDEPEPQKDEMLNVAAMFLKGEING